MCLELETEGAPTSVSKALYTFQGLADGSFRCDMQLLYENGAEAWANGVWDTLEEAQQAANEFHEGPPAVGSVHTHTGQVFLCVVGSSVAQIEQTYHCTRIKPTIETNTGDDNAN